MADIVNVARDSELLRQVQMLWKKNSSRLGPFPDGAFEEHAQEGCILAAVGDEGSLLGYVLFRTTRTGRAAIVHMCVDRSARQSGLARGLFEAMKARVAHCDEIRVSCRRDFEASRLWPRLGFVAVGERKGRKEGAILTLWRYELNPLPLLAAMSARDSDDPLPVVIDANIFFDLDDAAEGRQESLALQADWLGDFIELYVTDEIYNEINRREPQVDRTRQRARAGMFKTIQSKKEREQEVFDEMRKRFPQWTNENDQSDMRQLAKAIGAEATYFVTRDTGIRDASENIYDQYGLVILSPFELILQFDQLRREAEYRPRRFSGLGLMQSKSADSGLLGKIADLIHDGQPAPQPRRRTEAKLRDILASPERFDLSCITTKDNELVVAYAFERLGHDILRVPLFAVSSSDLGQTAARHFAERIIATAAAERRKIIVAEGVGGGQRVDEALSEAGFFQHGEQWVKMALPLVASASEIASELEAVGTQYPAHRAVIEPIANALRVLGDARSGTLESSLRAERALWPVKIVGSGLPCFIVPIQPKWARELFDTEMPQGRLFDYNPLLTMSPENAYYRAPKPQVVKAPARVLWYVSDPSKKNAGAMSLRASSYIEEVMIDGPKEVYRRFRRLGVYAWRDVFEKAGNDINNKVMAFLFSKTELFRAPIPWNRIQKTLLVHRGKEHPLVSPVEITEACFLDLYRLGIYGE